MSGLNSITLEWNEWTKLVLFLSLYGKILSLAYLYLNEEPRNVFNSSTSLLLRSLYCIMISLGQNSESFFWSLPLGLPWWRGEGRQSLLKAKSFPLFGLHDWLSKLMLDLIVNSQNKLIWHFDTFTLLTLCASWKHLCLITFFICLIVVCLFPFCQLIPFKQTERNFFKMLVLYSLELYHNREASLRDG